MLAVGCNIIGLENLAIFLVPEAAGGYHGEWISASWQERFVVSKGERVWSFSNVIVLVAQR